MGSNFRETPERRTLNTCRDATDDVTADSSVRRMWDVAGHHVDGSTPSGRERTQMGGPVQFGVSFLANIGLSLPAGYGRSRSHRSVPNYLWKPV
jgi:hypothetical protein